MDTIFSILIPVIVIGADQRISKMNEAAHTLVGADFTGQFYKNVIRQPELLAAIDETLATGLSQEVPFVQALAERDILYCASVVAGTDQSVVISFKDETGRDEVEQLRSEFVANVSHELRSPLTAVIGFIETLRSSENLDTATRARFLEIMGRETDRMSRLIEDLLSLSRVEAEERVRPIGVVDINSVLLSTVAICEGVAKKTDCQISLDTVEIPNGLKLRADKDQLQQVFVNLIENALNYGKNNGQVRIEMAYIAYDPALRSAALSVCVHNQGEGIDIVHIPRLTERFYRIDEDRSRNTGGTGLGLAIVKHIIHRHRGRLKISSMRGQGSSFCVLLPLESGHGQV